MFDVVASVWTPLPDCAVPRIDPGVCLMGAAALHARSSQCSLARTARPRRPRHAVLSPQNAACLPHYELA
jgi:hypothetical protein